jgi:uncharacterized membrane protein
MVGEEYGWHALDGLQLTLLILQLFFLVMIPGFLLSLAIFPKRFAMAFIERIALSFGLGLAPAFILMLLNVTLEVKVTSVTSIIAFLAICILGLVGFLVRGGNINLVQWYGTEKD